MPETFEDPEQIEDPTWEPVTLFDLLELNEMISSSELQAFRIGPKRETNAGERGERIG